MGQRTWPPHADRAAQGRQDRHNPARTEDRTQPRPRHRGNLDGPIFLHADGQRTDQHCASRIVRRAARHADWARRLVRTGCGTHSSPPRSTPASHFGTSRKPPRMPTRGPPCATTAPEPPSTATPPTSSPLTSPEPPGDSAAPRRTTGAPVDTTMPADEPMHPWRPLGPVCWGIGQSTWLECSASEKQKGSSAFASIDASR